jgi:hypothetical protein
MARLILAFVAVCVFYAVCLYGINRYWGKDEENDG